MIEVHTTDSSLSIRCASDTFEVRNSLLALVEDMEDRAFLPEETGTVELVLAEVLNNIAEHAYEDKGDGRIELDMAYAPGSVSFDLRDFGKPMPEGKTPLGELANLDVPIEDLPEGGFGWFLIGELAKDMVYERLENANHLRFRMTVGAPA
ncbi:ATP-binding protein [Shimia ponticola]|uniref:ATP-binding protein n=1 Tax=Shimia ponticola TaxID=2582893 RepID=UPI0011BFD8EB|nr:ATP-binding protein [Shimia ponticola]